MSGRCDCKLGTCVRVWKGTGVIRDKVCGGETGFVCMFLCVGEGVSCWLSFVYFWVEFIF